MNDAQRTNPEMPGGETAAASTIRPLAELQRHVGRHPYRTVAAALGVGYALGGGIFTPLTSRLLRLGIRIGIRTALLPVLKAELSEMANAFIGDEHEQGEPT